jgi:hypothetical protein
MIDTLKKFGMVAVATAGIWFGVAMADVVTGSIEIRNFAAILAFLSTMAVWIVLGLEQVGKTTVPTSTEKVKRESGGVSEDPRVALLMSLLTPDERATLKSRLADELSGDGEAVSLADLLAEQESARRHNAQ